MTETYGIGTITLNDVVSKESKSDELSKNIVNDEIEKDPKNEEKE